MSRPTQAVILAAGLGRRLGRGDSPKGLLRFGTRPIIEESIARLLAHGIERVLLVTGHSHGVYDDLVAQRPDVLSTVHNARYAESGSLFSLACARDLLQEDFLLLESDLVYERRALQVVLDDPGENVLLVSGPTAAGDEVWVETEGGDLRKLSKDKSTLEGGALGEFVGITRISARLFREMMECAAGMFAESIHRDYETDGLVTAAREVPVTCRLLPDLLWGEIDDQHHLERVRERVYPAILRRDGEERALAQGPGR